MRRNEDASKRLLKKPDGSHIFCLPPPSPSHTCHLAVWPKSMVDRPWVYGTILARTRVDGRTLRMP